MLLRSLSVLLLAVLLSCDALAQRNLTDIPDPDPEAERQTFKLPEGFEVQLFASDPVIAKPIQMNFDPAGRLWVVSSEVYPHLKPGQKPTDKVIVLEDTNGDGKADKNSTFAEGLFIPTGIAPGDGGVYVANSTQLLHLSDTDSDGKADKTRVVLSGFGTEDTHHLLHTLRWGPEGRLYFNQSIYIHSHIETPTGVKRLNGGGIWAFRPETLELDIQARGFINPWGHQFDRFGQNFATDGAGGEGINYVIPGAAFPTAVGVSRIMHGLNPGSPKHCGLEVISSSHLPDEWQGQMLTNDFRGHRVCRFDLERSGSGYISREQKELIVSNHVAFRPVDVKIGPDGAIYIADWYNPIIQHGEVDFRDPRRDQTHGRIWRVTWKGRKTLPNPNLHIKRVADLLSELKSPNQFNRHQAKRLLKEKGKAMVFPELQDLTSAVLAVEQTDHHYLLELQWVHESLRLANPALMQKLLSSSEPRIRAAAVRSLSHQLDRFPDAFEWLKAAATDSDPQVRLESLRALAAMNDIDGLAAAMQVLDSPMDKWLEYGLWLTIDDLKPLWTAELKKPDSPLLGDISTLVALARITRSADVTAAITRQLSRTDLDADTREELLLQAVRVGGPAEWQVVLDRITTPDSTKPKQLKFLRELLSASKSRSGRPARPASLSKFLDSDDAGVRQIAFRLTGQWKLQQFRPRLFTVAKSAELPKADRIAAIDGLTDLGGEQSVNQLALLAADATEVDVRVHTTMALARLNAQKGAPIAARLLSSGVPHEQTESITRAFLGQKNGPIHLANALQGVVLPAEVARIALRTVTGSGRPQPKLSAAITKAGKLEEATREMTAEEVVAFVDDVKNRGNAARGEMIYRRESLSCLNCHAIGGAGGRVGPDLISLGGSAQPDYILESLLKPNAKIKEGYQTLVVVNDEGQLFNGIKLRQTSDALVLRDAKDQEIGIPLDSIEDQSNGLSMMPKDLVGKLPRSELVDLVRFLSELGRTSEYKPTPEPFVRRWQVMSATKDAAYRLRRTRYAQAAQDDPAFEWKPRYSMVNGSLPMTDLPQVTVKNRSAPGSRGVSFARFEFEAARDGNVVLTFDSVDGIEAWLADEPLKMQKQITVPVSKGTHRVTLAVDQAQRTNGLLIQVQPGTSQAAPIAGK